MNAPSGGARRQRNSDEIRFFGRSFAFAGDLTPDEIRLREKEIEARGGSVHPYLNAVTDVLVVGRVEGTQSGAHWAREQIRRAGEYRARWGHLQVVREEELIAALDIPLTEAP